MAKHFYGRCRLCGNYGKLTFEHIPPRKAFNHELRLLRTIDDHVNKRTHTKFRKGLGKYSLCALCNSSTGGWYGAGFVSWTKQGFDWFDQVRDEKVLTLPYYIQPLNVLKQILVMGIALSTEFSIPKNQELRNFLLSPRARYMPAQYRVFVHFGMDGQLRFNSNMALLDTAKGSMEFILGEVALPPFGYCITERVPGRSSIAESKGLYELDWFSGYGYNEWATVQLRIPTKETNFPSPLDYRDRRGEE